MSLLAGSGEFLKSTTATRWRVSAIIDNVVRNFLIIIIGIVALNAVFLYSGGFEYIRKQFEPEETPLQIAPDVTDTFRKTLEEEVREKLGPPIEGYEPQMFLEVFPGLTKSDFDGVEASIGKYVLVEGQLEHRMEGATLIHSAAGSVTRRGYTTLYNNVARRMGIDLKNGGTLTDVMGALTQVD